MSRFLSNKHAGMDPYVPGEQPQDQQYVKLNTNESPFAPSPEVIKALSASEAEKLNLYSDPNCTKLNAAIAKVHGVTPEQVFSGNGSDELLAFAFLAFCGPDKKVCFPDVSYGFYPVFARLFNLDYLEIPLKADFSVDPTDYFGIGRTVFLANPNAPTGIALTTAQIAGIAKNNPDDLLVVDEAYADFATETALPLLMEYDNILIIRTFSKSRSLAGMRLGYAVSSPEIVAELNMMKFSFNPYNVDRLALLAGTAAMEDMDYFRACTAKTVEDREAFSKKLAQKGYFVLPSGTNFVFARHPKLTGGEFYKRLKKNGVLVRWFDKDRIRDFVRITIGSKEQMDAFFKAADAAERQAE